ncbi:hypothetical protein EDB89DRAFT_1850569 [Lactarius sanguifluus]|nr:hypothetical protein EDB89DRAFT_1850569 [Lactarius sanguifluus]
MAPSLETSTTSLLPLGLATPVCEVVDLISHHNARKRKCQETEGVEPKQAVAGGSLPYTPVQRGLASLAMTSASFLVSASPIRSDMALPPLFTTTITPPTQQDAMLLDVEPSNEFEAQLQAALHTSNRVVAMQKQVMVGMQAQTVLQSMYLEGVRGQLQAQEEKKIKKRKTGKINMDGRAKILTQDDIIEGVKEWQDGQDKAVEEAASKKKAREHWQYNLAMDVWKVREMDQKERNAKLKGGWEDDVRKWGIERDSAKQEHRKPKWTKPKMPPLEKAIHKPLVADFVTQGFESDKDDEDDGNEDDGNVDEGP